MIHFSVEHGFCGCLNVPFDAKVVGKAVGKAVGNMLSNTVGKAVGNTVGNAAYAKKGFPQKNGVHGIRNGGIDGDRA